VASRPTIQYLEPKVFDEETINWLYDERGRLRGATVVQYMTREELEKIYGPVEKLDISTAF